MALKYGDRVQETVTTTGTGTYSLGGAATGYQAFSAVLSNSDTCYYAATDGTNWEVGLGTYTSAGNTLARTTILASSNSGSAVNWSAGTKNIWLDLPASIASVLNAGIGHLAGIASNTAASAGEVGEVISNSATGVSLTANTAANATSISLTAGDWDVNGGITFVPAGSTTVAFVNGSIGTTTASIVGSPDPSLFGFSGSLNTGAACSMICGTKQIIVNTTTTVYLVANSNFGVSTMTVNGFLRARRKR